MRTPAVSMLCALMLLVAACGSAPVEAPTDATQDRADASPALADAPDAVDVASDALDACGGLCGAGTVCAAGRCVALDGAADATNSDATSDALDASDGWSQVDIGPPPDGSEISSAPVVRVAFSVAAADGGAPAVYIEARNVRLDHQLAAELVDFNACGLSGCVRASAVFTLHTPPTREAFSVEGGGVAWSMLADVSASSVYTVMRPTAPERLRNYVARFSSPSTAEHGAVAGVDGATSSPMVGEVWLMGAPAIAP